MFETIIHEISIEPLSPFNEDRISEVPTSRPIRRNGRPIILTLAKFVLSPEVKDQLETACQIRLDYVDNVRELFNYITRSSRHIHTIIIGSWPEVFTEAKLSIIEVINAVRTLIHCSGQDIKLAVGINSDVDPKTIQEIRRMPIDYIWPGGTEFSVDIKIETMTAILSGEHFIHPKLDAILKPRRCKPKTDTVNLTPRQNQIMEIVSQRGASNKAIARMLNITESTVKLHMSGILKKYGVRNRTQLALFARDKDEA